MSVTQYIGARYVPLFADPAEWDNTRAYEPLTVVLHQGASYTSRQAVPIGIDISNQDYWVLTGNYNAQVEQYRQEVMQFADDIGANSEAIAAETAAREEAIAAETTARQEADSNLTENIEGQISALTEDIEGQISIINGPGWVTGERLAPESVTYDALSQDVKKMHSVVTKIWAHIHVNATTGDDETGNGSETAPFKSLDRAIEFGNERNSNFSIVFQSPGTYYLSYSYFVGAVIHFRVWSQCPAGHIHISRTDLSETRGFYLYDSHLNITGTENSKFIIDMPNAQFEEEGSTLWLNYVEFNVSNILLVQGGMHAAHVNFNCPISAYFAGLQIMYSYSNNQKAAPALSAISCTVRLTGNPPFQMYRNANGASNYGLSFNSCRVTMNSALGLAPGVTNSNYQKYLYSSASIIGATDDWIANYNTYGNENVQLTGLSLRIAETIKVPTN